MKSLGNRTFMGTVLFLDLGEAAQRSPAPELQQRVREVVSRTVGHLPTTERILLDTGHGAVVCFPGDPEDAVFVAIGIRDSLQQESVTFPELQVRLGVNLGPVRVVEEGPGQTQLLGEGMHGAEAMLEFAAPSQILASRSFFELVSSLSDEYRELFHHHGPRRLGGTRDVDLYELAPVGGARAMAEATWPAGRTPAAVGAPASPAAGRAPAPAAQPVPAPPAPAVSPSRPAAGTPASGWRPEALAELSAALAKAMGPLAPMLVKRSAQQTDDPRVLCDLLADALTDDADRTAFLLFARRWTSGARKSSPPSEPTPASGTAQAQGRLSPEERAKLEAALSPHLGPIARVLVDRVAQEAPNLAVASEKLASSVPEGNSRRTFMQTMTMLQQPAGRPAPQRQRPAAPPAAPPFKADPQRPPARATQAVGGTQPLVATRFLAEEVLLQAERSLARALGPMARALVRRSAQSARSAAELYAALAEELPEGPERERFLASRDHA
jgi:class 3 adenylate cyclase